MQIRKQLYQYAYLMRLDKPIGILLLLWPTLWALWLASEGHPHQDVFIIFMIGTLLMRSAGCIVNDINDRHIDGYVKRTRERPLIKGTVTTKEAWLLAASLALVAFLLVLLCSPLTILLAVIGAILTLFYPLMKRFTHLPQLGLGIAFTWGVPMAFAAEVGAVSFSAWFLFLTGMLWPIIYDTMYAMVDREDDMKIGVKSTAILFNRMDKLIIGILQIVFIVMLIMMGLLFHLHAVYYDSLAIVCLLFMYQQWLIKDRDTKKCFAAFLNSNWVGATIFIGILLSYL